MTEDDLLRMAERYTELINPGQWAEMTDPQKAVSLLHVGKALHAALLEGFMVRNSPVKCRAPRMRNDQNNQSSQK